METIISQMDRLLSSVKKVERENKALIEELRAEINVRIQREAYIVNHVKGSLCVLEGMLSGKIVKDRNPIEMDIKIMKHVLQDMNEKRTLQYPLRTPEDHQVWLHGEQQ